MRALLAGLLAGAAAAWAFRAWCLREAGRILAAEAGAYLRELEETA